MWEMYDEILPTSFYGARDIALHISKELCME